jgi:signal transduction histidine kinase
MPLGKGRATADYLRKPACRPLSFAAKTNRKLEHFFGRQSPGLFLLLGLYFEMKAACVLLVFLLWTASDSAAQSAEFQGDSKLLIKKLELATEQNPGDPQILQQIDAFGLQAKRRGDSLDILYYYRLKSHYFHAVRRYEEALNAAILGVQMDPKWDVEAHFQLLLDVISNYWNLGEYSKAVPYLIQGENQLSEKGIRGFYKGVFFNFMGQYHYNEHANEKALEFFVRGDSLLDVQPSFFPIEVIWKQNLKSNIGLALLDLKRYSEAEPYFDQAFDVSKSIDNQPGMGFALMNKVRCSRNRFQDSSFAPQLRQALAWVGKDADFSLRTSVLHELARDFFKQNQTDSLLAILPSLETSVDFLPNTKSKVKHLFYLAQYYAPLNINKSILYFGRVLELNDSLLANPSNQNLLQIERERNRFLKEQEAKHLFELKAEQLRKNVRLTTFFLVSAIAFLVLLVGLLVALLRKDRRLGKTLKNLRWQISNSSNLNQQLQLSMQQKNLLLGAVAHDLRNVLVNVNQVSEMLMNNELDKVPEFKDRMVKLMERSSKLGMHTIEDLIEGVQPEGRLKLRLEEVNPSDSIDFVVDLLSFKAEKKGISLHLKKVEFSATLMADRDKLNRALINLLDNAIKFSPIEAQVHLSFHSTPDFLIFTVQDFGKGLHRARYLEGQNPFDDDGQLGTLGEASTGLGLFIVRKIAELHMGSFRLNSTEGMGTTAEFTVFRRLS